MPPAIFSGSDGAFRGAMSRLEKPPALAGGVVTSENVCEICGCTDQDACWDEAQGQPCHWVSPGLCSTCAHIDQALRLLPHGTEKERLG